MSPVLVAAFVVTGLIALALIRAGWIGRAIDDHPICRSCGFDLFNLPADRAACPECGADLKARRAVRVGNRARRRLPLYFGLALLVLTASLAILVGTHVAGRIDAYRYVPDAWVERDARSGHPSRRATAWAELTRRFKENGVSAERKARLVDAALQLQADTKIPWATEIGDFVEAARKANALPDDKWLRYAKQAPRLSLYARPRIGRGHPIAAELVEDGDRVAADSRLLVRLIDVQPDGNLVIKPDAPKRIEFRGAEQLGTGSFRELIDIKSNPAAMQAARLGKQAVEVAATLEVLEGHELDQGNAKLLFRERMERKAEFDLVEPQDVALEIIPDDSPELRKRIEAAIQVTGATAMPRAKIILIRTSATAPPVPLAFRVTVRQGDSVWQSGRVTEANSSSSGAFFVPADTFPGDRIDVIYEPDPNVALGTIDMTRMWNGRLEFRDIPIDRPKSATTQP